MSSHSALPVKLQIQTRSAFIRNGFSFISDRTQFLTKFSKDKFCFQENLVHLKQFQFSHSQLHEFLTSYMDPFILTKEVNRLNSARDLSFPIYEVIKPIVFLTNNVRITTNLYPRPPSNSACEANNVENENHEDRLYNREDELKLLEEPPVELILQRIDPITYHCRRVFIIKISRDLYYFPWSNNPAMWQLFSQMRVALYLNSEGVGSVMFGALTDLTNWFFVKMTIVSKDSDGKYKIKIQVSTAYLFVTMNWVAVGNVNPGAAEVYAFLFEIISFGNNELMDCSCYLEKTRALQECIEKGKGYLVANILKVKEDQEKQEKERERLMRETEALQRENEALKNILQKMEDAVVKTEDGSDFESRKRKRAK
jgi:hypothetical protein